MSRALVVLVLGLLALVHAFACVQLSDRPCPDNNQNPLRFTLAGVDANGTATYVNCPVGPPVSTQSLGPAFIYGIPADDAGDPDAGDPDGGDPDAGDVDDGGMP